MLEADFVLPRIWLCLSLLLFAPTEGGLWMAFSDASDTVCAQRCPDDDSSGQCAPDCADCTCCGHVRSVSAAPVASSSLLWIAPRPRPVMVDEDAPASADLDDILHVPRADLA
ncbi:hypothetical protein ACN47A_09645 [Myxococcus fulvus]|uniref:hypothetical protein n=1 Tax=Myxococcus fulvus TaxID=33 RepID=UPI003B9B07BA